MFQTMKKLSYILLSTIFLFQCGEGSDGEFDIVNGGTSQGGSLARFAIVGNFLYIVNDFSLIPVSIANLQVPETLSEIELGIGIETIFPYNNHLFIGSSSAVYIYSIANDPAKPQYRSIYQHSTGCDPVVVSGNYAYVTLRSGTFCNNLFNINVLDVVDVSNLTNPRQVFSVSMSNPRGLGVGCSGKLYVCEGPGGLKQFDITNPAQPVLEQVYPQYAANDVIVKNDLLIVTGTDGVYQYSCASDTLQLLSILPYAL